MHLARSSSYHLVGLGLSTSTASSSQLSFLSSCYSAIFCTQSNLLLMSHTRFMVSSNQPYRLNEAYKKVCQSHRLSKLAILVASYSPPVSLRWPTSRRPFILSHQPNMNLWHNLYNKPLIILRGLANFLGSLKSADEEGRLQAGVAIVVS